ncbi:glycerol-3-phosphate dehydrogenase/oxidase [Pelagibacterium sediminicola]|uniref:glycerol-3-phosphate dehydrogenase/oxidase n=1 Tax=Pelagibacterium sediminicola TaxID=2248761 RepID=UPI000E30CC08|nr:glycerol-3-phosphate dehydrogenase/oxidase [Pelagibacterium sediminicola]
MNASADIAAALNRLAADEPLADRAAHLERLAGGSFDLLVVGGGITGAGVALDAVSRGLSVALVEGGDFASGTSSRSSKMIHGGFRYLQTGDVALVRESLRERHALQRNAPHLVRVMPFMIPLFLKGGVINPKLSRALGGALWSYQLAGAWRLGRRHKRLSHEEVGQHMPALDMERIGAGYMFYDLRGDDARIVFAVLASAAERGAVVVNHARCIGLSEMKHGRRTARIEVDGTTIEVSAGMVVNATGVWAQTFLDGVGVDSPRKLAPAKGTHIVLPIGLMRNDVAVSLPVASDRRTVSVVDQGPFVYVGSTETTDPADVNEPSVTESDLTYILDGINRHLTRKITPDDITSGWAGFRPLIADGKSAHSSDLSRRHSIEQDAEGLITVTGGKLTTYREMAEGTVDAVCAALGRKAKCTTRQLRLHGYCPSASHLNDGERLGKRYGDRAAKVEELAALSPALAGRITPRGETIVAEALWGLRAEMGASLADVLFRRTRIATYDGRAVLADVVDIAARIGRAAGWTDNRITAETETLKTALRQELGVLALSLPHVADNSSKEDIQ